MHRPSCSCFFVNVPCRVHDVRSQKQPTRYTKAAWPASYEPQKDCGLGETLGNLDCDRDRSSCHSGCVGVRVKRPSPDFMKRSNSDSEGLGRALAYSWGLSPAQTSVSLTAEKFFELGGAAIIFIPTSSLFVSPHQPFSSA